MSDSPLDSRRRALEDAFFIEQDTRLKRRLEEESARHAEREAIIRTTGITDATVIDQLIRLNLHGPALAALALVPLVVVAWADGDVGVREHRAVLAVAEELGLEPDSASHQLLDEWLLHRPPPSLLAAWEAYTTGFVGKLDAAGRAALREEVMGRAEAVAEAQGGFITFGRISAAEEAMLERLEATLS